MLSSLYAVDACRGACVLSDGGTAAAAAAAAAAATTTGDGAGDGGVAVPLRFSSTDDGRCFCKCKLTAAGDYRLVVSVAGEAVPASQLWLRVHAAAVSPSHSGVFPGTRVDGAVLSANEPATFGVVARDCYGNVCAAEPPPVTCRVLPEGVARVGIETHDDGCAMVSLLPSVAGDATVHVDMGGTPLLGSPFQIHVLSGAAHGPSSFARGDGLVRARQREHATFEVVLRDAAGNGCTRGGEPLRVTISPRAAHNGDYGEVLSVSDRLDGTFLVSYVCGLSGRYTIAVTLRGEPIQGSPFTVHVPLEPPSVSAASTPRAAASPRPSSARATALRGPSPLRVRTAGTPLVTSDAMLGRGGLFSRLSLDEF